MNQKLEALWAKAVENKAVLIPVGTALLGALIGATVATAFSNARQDLLLEEVFMEQVQTPTVTE